MSDTSDGRSTLQSFERAARREGHNLSRWPELLWQQLHNRLQWEAEPLPEVLAPELTRRTSPDSGPWLRTALPFGESPAAERILGSQSDNVFACAVSPDGSFIVSGNADGSVKIWDTSTGEERATLTGHRDGVMGCAIGPDGSLIVSASLDGTLKVWEVAGGTERMTLAGHDGPVRGCAVSPDGSFAVSASEDRTLKVWDLTSGSERTTLRGHDDEVRTCAVSPDGSFVVSGSNDATLKIWDTANWEEQRTLKGDPHHEWEGHYSWVLGCAVSPDGSFIVSVSRDATVKVWSVAGGHMYATLAGHGDMLLTCAVSPDGSFLVSGGADKTLKVWDAPPEPLADFHPSSRDWRERTTLLGHAFWVTASAIAPDASFIVSAGSPGGLRIWDVSRARGVPTRGRHLQMVTGSTVSPGGDLIVTASDDHTLKLWDGDTGAERATLVGHTEPVLGCSMDGEGTIASAGADGTVRLWDAATGNEVATLSGHTDPVWDCDISPDGSVVVSAGQDRTLKVWDPAEKTERATLRGHLDTVSGCAVSPDGSFVVSASWDGTLMTWDAFTAARRGFLRGHADKVWRCAVSPDAGFIVSVSADGTARIWDAASGRERLAFGRHAAPVRGCAVSPDGLLVATADEGGVLKVWDADTGAERATIPALGTMAAVAFHPASPRLVCGDLGDNLYLIDLVGVEYGSILSPRVAPRRGKRERATLVDRAREPASAAEGYVAGCLRPAFEELEEERTWDSDPSFRDVLDPLNRQDHETAAREAEKLVGRFPDLHLGYAWWASALLPLGELEQAREVLLEGLQRSRKKYTLCTKLGELEWKAGDLAEAVYWWVQAVLAQESLERYGGDVGSYLHLHYVAVGVEAGYEAMAFLRRVDAIQYGQIRLDEGVAASLRGLASRNGTPEIREVLAILRTRYLDKGA